MKRSKSASNGTIGPTPADLRRIAAAVFVWTSILAGAGVFAGDCGPVPRDVVLEPGQTLKVDGAAFEVVATTDPPAGTGTTDAGILRINVLARPLGAVSRRPRVGGFLPWAKLGFVLHDHESTLAQGALGFRMSSRGPAHGIDLPLGDLAGLDEVQIDVTVNDRPFVGAAAGSCMPLPYRFGARLALDRVPESTDGTGTFLAPSDNRNMTLLSTVDLRPSQNYSDVWGYSQGGTVLAIIGSTDGTLFVDVTDPMSPVETGFIDGPDSSWRDIKTYLNYAYIVTEGAGSGQGVQIVDLSDPLSPDLVATYTTTVNTAHNIYIEESTKQAWVVGTDDGTRILDLTDPENPVEVGSWTTRYVHDAYVVGDNVYFSEVFSGLHEILDAANPANLQILSSWATPDSRTHNSWANDAQTLLATTDEVTGGHIGVYDISSKTGPIPLLGEYDPNPNAVVHNVIFDDDDNEVIAMSHYNLGLKYVDLHRPGMPVELGSYDTRPSTDNGFGGAWGVYPFDPRGYIYVSDIQTGLYVLRYDPTGGTLSGVVRSSADSTPVAGARVIFVADGSEHFAGADGVYAGYAPGGPSVIRVTAPGFKSRIVDGGTLLLGERLDVDVDLDPLPQVGLSGVIRREDTLAGIAGAKVRIVGTTLETVSASDGSYAFTQIPVGQRTLTAEAFGFASQEARIVLIAAGGASLDVSLEPGRFVDDVETSQGWVLGQLDDQALSGVWERVDPVGTAGGTVQPEDDHTQSPGVTAFITGQATPFSDPEASDVDGGVTTLVSPTIDTLGLGAARLRYYRWLSTDAGDIDPGGFLRVEISPDQGTSWFPVEFTGQNQNAWVQQEFDVGSLIPLTDKVVVRFRAEPSSGFEDMKVLECGVDDVELVRGCLTRFAPEGPDVDADGIRDACDGCPLDVANDADGDGICGDVDNAPFVSNPAQTDADSDGLGDAADNCAGDPNPDQRDLDGDGQGDVCDDDIDGDGSLNAADTDDDDDGIADVTDLCPGVPDPGQADFDSDGQGDACDADDGLVRGLRLDGDRLTWLPEAGSDGYNLYRGPLGVEGLLPLAGCRSTGIPAGYYVDPDLPIPGDGYLYLVARVSSGVEGSLGAKSDGAPRVVNFPCLP